MKLKLTYKSPDTIDYALSDARIEDPDELEDTKSILYEMLGSTEYVTIEVDTETRTMKVLSF
jgi:hypothetical protein